MKLYFYYLKLGKIHEDECEVDEKPKTYKAINTFPECTYNSSVKKSDIGKGMEYFRGEYFVVLTEKDKGKACDSLVEIIEQKIDKFIDDMRNISEKIKNNQALIDYIKKQK